MSRTNPPDSGIEGEIILRPISPVERPGMVNSRPYQATVTVLDANGQTVTQFQSDVKGHFQINLPPGTYTLRPESPSSHPFARQQTVTVSEKVFTRVLIAYDSGIRGLGLQH
ncbi:carboxypeptidase regulatory-like domain-containing protein [Candidatus Acetothermia bacterium]|nr:carboxypeptidase regulatory-like domain-containing protein [Candidatus Acetothermia bacterium]MBI3460671.1 carboxypeptidase regulatory-like domain-containing protein [Candidatus Acetothermia bacterium]MBI3661187.1 carboxypeptidase regulatory-like domain-containing protein [Candidatus Acetothermia bacterium]